MDLLEAAARAAPVRIGRVDFLMNRPEAGVHVPVDRLDLDCIHGIRGDRWERTAWLKLADGRPDPRVQVSLTNTQVMRCFTGEAPESVYGCGDNVYVDWNLIAGHLPVGSRFRIGEAVLQVSDVINDACGKFATRFGVAAFQRVRAPENVDLRLRGIFCAIVRGGCIRIGDTIERIVD